MRRKRERSPYTHAVSLGKVYTRCRVEGIVVIKKKKANK